MSAALWGAETVRLAKQLFSTQARVHLVTIASTFVQQHPPPIISAAYRLVWIMPAFLQAKFEQVAEELLGAIV